MERNLKKVIVPILFLLLIAIFYFYQLSIEKQFQNPNAIGETTATVIKRKFARSGFSYEVKYKVNNVTYIGRVNTDTLNLPLGSIIPINYLLKRVNKVRIASPGGNTFPIKFK